MLQQTPYFLLSRPLMFFGTAQEFTRDVLDETEYFEEEDSFDLLEFPLEGKKMVQSDQKIGVFIHWR